MRAEKWKLLSLAGAVALAMAGPASTQDPGSGNTATADTTRDRVLTGDQVIEAGEVASDIAVVGGDLTIRGRVTGNAVVVGGDLIMEDGGEVMGDVTVTGGRVIHEGGTIRGEMREIDAAGGAAGAALKDRIRDEIKGAERTARAEEARERSRRAGDSGWFRSIRRGFSDLISTLALGLVLAGIGGVLVFYGRPNLETVSDTLRAATARSAGVGLAAAFLIVPAFVVMVVALAVSIVGIPVLLIAVPLYPLAIAAGIALGLLAAAHAIGERTAEQKARPFERRWSNSYSYLFTGLGMILTPLIAASLLEMTGFLDFLGTILKVFTWIAIWAMATAGFGAVILSRAGTRRTFVAPAPDNGFESDPLFDDEFSSSGSKG
jgi:hypothetical protein